MSPLSGKLPEWPADATKIYADGDAEERKAWAIVDYWESRCRLAVEALKDYAAWVGGTGEREWNLAAKTLKAIGPLPKESP